MTEEQQQIWIRKLKKLRYPTPFIVTDLGIASKQVKLLSKLMPRINFYYAVKSNADKKLIQHIDNLVVGYDVASLGEFTHLKEQGIKSDRILYSNPVKIPEHIDQTYKSGVNYFAFDSVDEIRKLAKYAPGSNVYLRLKVSDYGSKFPLSVKFGVDPLHAVAYMDMAAEAGLNPVGLAFHVGSQSENPQTWAVAFETCRDIINKLEKAGINITIINIGGGFPARYAEEIVSIEQTAKLINKLCDKYIPEEIKIIAEPGRFISAESSVIVSSVIGREVRGSTQWMFLDMGVFQGLMEPLEINGWKYPVFTDYGKKAHVFSKPFVLTGPTCDAYDTIGDDYLLPSNIGIGDRIYIGSTGAYSLVYSSNFNGFNPPKQYYIQ